MTLSDLKNQWVDTPQHHKHMHELFTELVNNDWGLNDHRTYIETKVFGMGERSFWYLWKLILAELPDNPKLLEIGVFKASTMSLWKMLREDAQVFGVTPLDGRGTGWTEDDYAAHIKNIHNDFGLEQPTLIIGSSTDDSMVYEAMKQSPFDIVYVDGDHSESGALSDFNNYAPMVKIGGYLAIDDCCCDMSMEFGFFQGIQPVQDAFDKWDKSNFEFVCNIVHLRILKRVS